MDNLVFAGDIVNGIGKHSRLIVPGGDKLPHPPNDWPVVLVPGSLNVHIKKYPDSFQQRGMGLSFDELDSGHFEPAFEIPQSLMLNNKLTPIPSNPRRGIAQIWKASIAANGYHMDCWVLICSSDNPHLDVSPSISKSARPRAATKNVGLLGA
jgi:hypothetical protein